ncbi:hypothetical protein [Microbispora bryophytorum]|uniref:Pentapeptide repeat-containing protein n=1 Tax=Microbispora bryophytorum TaxID=1460882 RepID=A0A8H9GUD1_9ACTN|nr:hypothetical protein [Microbispora bryophytorum]MBD3138943.1 hypothetical protein [Microbispora bryophytorum]TQS10194.1 hypothetical protein FLX07_04075 [Microbispora bryophytorum]GGO01053.1 hypothetical protein GCM10011574_08430 [Microbispora bryophytorum]
MRRPIRLMTLAALTCAGLLATAPAYAGCGCDAPKAAKPAAAADLGARADAGLNVGVGLGVGLNVGLDLGLDLGLNAQAGTNAGTMSCGKPTVLRRCH